MRYEGLRPNFDRKMLRESGPWGQIHYQTVNADRMSVRKVYIRSRISVIH